jgi:IPT/TIG domain.
LRFLKKFTILLSLLLFTKSFGSNNEVNLILVAPTINNINPTEYCYNNPQNITISGTNLASVTTVYIGTTNIPDITVSDTTIIINSIPVGTLVNRLE